MFFPADSLRRGGRYYLLWLADSWPRRFEAISDRQIRSQDILKLCDELNALILSESGRPTHRYSLRLSSQLMRGLVRLYHRKTQLLLRALCMFEVTAVKQAKKKDIVDGGDRSDDEATGRPLARVPKRRQRTTAVLPQEPEALEQRIEEILQNSTNVANIEDITLRESIINVPVQPPNEGFGEESVEQTLKFLSSRRSVEQMMVPAAGAHHSGLELPATDATRAPLDVTRFARAAPHMERLSGLDLTALRPSDGGLLSTTDLGREISDIPILPIPEVPDSREKQPQEAAVEIREDIIEQSKDEPRRQKNDIRESTQIELEELEEIGPRMKKQRKLIIDKKTQLSSDFLRQRIQNPRVELRVNNITKVAAVIKIPCDIYMNRPCHAGFKERSNVAPSLTRLFMRNLGFINREKAHKQLEEEATQRQPRYPTRSLSKNIAEVEERPPAAEPLVERARETSVVVGDILPPSEEDVSSRAHAAEHQDIADMLTQKLEILPQQQDNNNMEKRSGDEPARSSKKQKTNHEVPLRENRPRQQKSEAKAECEARPADTEVDKENIAANQQALESVRLTRGSEEKRVSSLLREAGLADGASAGGGSGEESLLGSLDRTEVSLGDSVQTTESMKLIKNRWGAEGTMIKIVKYIRHEQPGETVTVQKLVATEPITNGYKNIITAKCFTSVLKLKQHGFVKIKKCPETLEILDITLGPRMLKIFY